jgi:hypothetical protein
LYLVLIVPLHFFEKCILVVCEFFCISYTHMTKATDVRSEDDALLYFIATWLQVPHTCA